MPSLEQQLDEQVQLRLLIYGAAKTKKTWWIGTAAEAGFNVLLLNGDKGANILSNLSPEAQKRVYVLNVYDDSNRAVFAEFMTRFLKGVPFNWDEQARKFAIKPGDTTIRIEPLNLPANTVVANDSWTALAWSLAFRYCLENAIDLSDAERQDWDGYRWTGALATWMMQQWKKLPYHTITVGHQDNYEKRSKDGKKIEWSRMQIKSTSGPHAMQLAKDFTDILYFSVRGSAFQIDSGASHERDGGSQIVPPKTYQWNDLQFKDVCKLAGIPLPQHVEPLNFAESSAPVQAAGKQQSQTTTTTTTKEAEPKPVIKPSVGSGLKINMNK